MFLNCPSLIMENLGPLLTYHDQNQPDEATDYIIRMQMQMQSDYLNILVMTG